MVFTFLTALKVQKDASYFSANPKEAEDLIAGECKDHKPENKSKCDAAKEGLNKFNEAQERQNLIKDVLTKPQEEANDKASQPTIPDEFYIKKFRDEPDKIAKIMKSKCNKLFSDPEYYKNNGLKDRECDIAKEEQARIKQLEKLKPEAKKTEKNIQYFKQNIIETKKHISLCEKNEKKDESCQYAQIALNEHNSDKKTRQSLQRYFEGSILAAKNTIDECQKEIEKDNLKCAVAFKVYNKNFNKKRNEMKFNNYLKHFRTNLSQAKKLLKTKCKSFSSSNNESIFIDNDKCAAVRKAIEEKNQKDEKLELLKALNKYKKIFIEELASRNAFNSKKYKILIESFKINYKDTEDFIASCIENKTRATVSSLECLAATNVIIELLENAKKHEEEKERAKKEYKNYYRKYFAENPHKATQLLEGRCKIVFANEWYQYDKDIKDEECEAALSERKRMNKKKKQEEIEKLNSLKNDESYFIENMDVTKQIANQCINGTIKNLHDCEMSLITLERIKTDNKKRREYKQYYKKHILAAKYKLKWCKANMVKFDTHCYVVFDILKDHKDNVLDEEKYKEKLDFFSKNSMEANITLNGKCAEPIKNNWYFLDVNMQTEECNAAFEVIRGYD